MNPQNVRTAEFKTVRKGLDPSAVDEFLAEVADALERAQNHATAMEARARAAVQRAQEVSASVPESEAAGTSEPAVSVDESETISRTLLLAQRTADTTLAEARSEAELLRTSATEEATRELDAARELAAQMAETARASAQEALEAERASIEQDLAEMSESRDLLAADVNALQSFLDVQRERVRDAASTLLDLTERVPGGLAAMLVPELSTVDEHTDDRAPDDSSDAIDVADDAVDRDPAPEKSEADTGEVTAESADADESEGDADGETEPDSDELVIVTDLDETADPTAERPVDSDDEPGDATPIGTTETGSGLRFNFNDE